MDLWVSWTVLLTWAALDVFYWISSGICGGLAGHLGDLGWPHSHV